MRKGFGILAFCLCAQFGYVRAEAGDQDKDVQEVIQSSFNVLLDGSPSEDQVRGALNRILEAIVLILPQTEQSRDARSNLKAAILELKDGSLLSEKGGQRLAMAYRSLNAGKGFQFPEIQTIEEAKAHISKLVASSLASLREGRDEETSKKLLECVLMIVTPMAR